MVAKTAILVVEDDADSAEMLAEMLAMADYAVETAGTADLALSAMATGHYDAALLDLTLPGVSTAELIERVVGVKGRPPIVIFSAQTADDLRRAGERLDAAAVIQKPVRMETLIATMAQAARRGKA
jgi:two-component system phosphate regulon response regulator OmpR